MTSVSDSHDAAQVPEANPPQADGNVVFDGDLSAWVSSFTVHIALLVLLALASVYAPPPERLAALVSTIEPEEQIEVPDQFHFSDVPQEEVGAASERGRDIALGLAPNVSDVSIVPTNVESVDRPVERLPIQQEFELVTGPNFSENLEVRGAAGVGATGAVGAVDRITHEILLSLEQQKTLVVWLFDESLSLQAQRKSVVERFDRIYHELGVVESRGNPAFKQHDKKPLLTAVVGFGEKVSFLTPKPTDDAEEIKAAVNAITVDKGGVERTFQAVYQSVEKYRSYHVQDHRNLMIVIFTDEAGNDPDGLDGTLAMCRRYEVPVFCVGVPAPFGRKEALVKFVDPDPKADQSPMMVPVDQGPESCLPEMIKLGQLQSDEAIDSGFGPYALTRLCYETGGIYFAVHPNRGERTGGANHHTAAMAARLSHFFDPEVMRSYRPDYVSIRQYQKLLTQNKARAALVQASQLSWVTPMDQPQLVFPKVSEADLVNRLNLAQRAAAVLEPKLAQLYEVLRSGEGDRSDLTGPRWQAGYDLAMGRLLAVKVRTEAYNAMLAKAKQGMRFTNFKNDTWRLEPSSEVVVGSTLEKQAKQAKTYLERVVHEHPETPWALLAERELKQPLGWAWKESFTGVSMPRQREGAGNNNNRPLPSDEKAKDAGPPRPAPLAEVVARPTLQD